MTDVQLYADGAVICLSCYCDLVLLLIDYAAATNLLDSTKLGVLWFNEWRIGISDRNVVCIVEKPATRTFLFHHHQFLVDTMRHQLYIS